MTREVLGRQPTGVRILLSPGVNVDQWILTSEGVSLNQDPNKDRGLPVLEVRKGDAGFIGGGSVDLRIGRQRVYRVGFQSDEVLEIQTSNGELMKRNHRMCVECGRNTGRMINYSISQEVTGTVDASFQCEQNPDHRWELKQI